MRSGIFGLLIILSACGYYGGSRDRQTIGPIVTAPTVSVNLLGTYLNNLNSNAAEFDGACNIIGQEISLRFEDSASTVLTFNDVAECESPGAWAVLSGDALDLSSLLDGNITITATHANGAGDTASDVLVAVKDVVAPVVTLTAPTDGATLSHSPQTLAGNCETSGDSIQFYYDDGINLNFLGGTTCAIDNTFAIAANITSIPDGPANFIAVETDAHNNTGTSAPVATTVDLIPSIDSTLSSLSFDPVGSGLSPPFSANVLSYTMDQDLASSDVTVTATSTDEHATLRLRINTDPFTPITSGIATSPIPISVGITLLRIQVLAQDGISSRTYSITVVKLGGGFLGR